jgi:hypothetical protein
VDIYIYIWICTSLTCKYIGYEFLVLFLFNKILGPTTLCFKVQYIMDIGKYFLNFIFQMGLNRQQKCDFSSKICKAYVFPWDACFATHDGGASVG